MTTEPVTNTTTSESSATATDAALDSVVGQSAEMTAAATDVVQRLQRELEEARTRLLRSQADLENFRKRTRREFDDERRFANLPLLADLLPVLDNVGRAVQAAEKAADGGALLEGVKLVAQQLESVLARHHCTRINAAGSVFDPHLHQAILQQPSIDRPPGTVLMVAQEGYQLHDRVLRPAQVIVSSAPESSEDVRPETL
jgi:molecular chaperone GrpE